MSSPAFVSRLSGILAGLVGVIVFTHYFWPSATMREAAQPILRSVVLLGGMTLVLMAWRLCARHIRQWRQPESAALLVGMALALGAGLGPGGYTAGPGRWLYEWLLRPGWAALLALLPFFLVAALWRRLQVDGPATFAFVAGLLLMLVAQTPLLIAAWPGLADLRHLLLTGLVAPVLRGVLIGLSLGVVLGVLIRRGGKQP